MSALYLDGIGCNPNGMKPRFIRGLGYRVTAPMLPDLDFGRSVEIAEECFQRERPEVVVGYSRGASVALSLTDRSVPRLLIGASLHWVAEPVVLTGALILLHVAEDECPISGPVQQQMERLGLPLSALRIVGKDHSMIDAEALAAIKASLAELSDVQP